MVRNKVIKDTNLMMELEGTRPDANDFQDIKIKVEDIIPESEIKVEEEEMKSELFVIQGIKIEKDEEKNFWSEEEVNCDGVFLHSFSEEKFQIPSKLIDGQRVTNADKIEAKYDGANCSEYHTFEKCTSVESEDIQDSCCGTEVALNFNQGMRYKCSSCNCSFHWKYQLENHAASIHGKEKPFKCAECDFSNSQKGNLTRHIRFVHKKEKSFKCTECEFSCSRKETLTGHIRAVHRKEKPIKCTECDNSFSQRGALSLHIRGVHRKEKPFKCTECGYVSSRKNGLIIHVRAIHRNEKLFKCIECDYSFSQKKNLVDHIRTIHRKEKPFNCIECDYSCSRKGNLSLHVRSVHRKE